jgi:hypothetical protein
VKRTNALFIAACAAALLLQTHPAALAENSAQPRKEDTTEEKPGQITAEDKEVIEHMEMLKNLKLYKTEDIEMLLTLDVLTANE